MKELSVSARTKACVMCVFQVFVERLSATLAFAKPGAVAAPVMPFIDDDLLWPDNDNDTKIPDLSQCLANVSRPTIVQSHTYFYVLK